MCAYFCFVSSETKRIYLDVTVNNLNSEVKWPIKTEFVIENLNICEMTKQKPEVSANHNADKQKAKEMGDKYDGLTI